jgi:pyruvate formate lyase activating enzyme
VKPTPVDFMQQTCAPTGVSGETTANGGYVHSIETGAAVDGPGVRCAIFLSGCNMHCLYCHNPDTWKLKNGSFTTVSELMAKITPYLSFLKRAGGVTISGGEPLVQKDFALAILQACKALGLHTALDTQGYFGARLSDQDLQAVDLVLLDVKLFDPAGYQRLTGAELAPTLAFAERLSRQKIPVWLRYVLVPGYTDAELDIQNLAAWAAELGNIERVDVLPFHQLGQHKWEELGKAYALATVEPPTHAAVERARHIFLAQGLTVV